MKSITFATAVLLTALNASACDNLNQSWELDHARVIAVRVEPPSLAPGQQGKITALVVSEDGTPSEISPAIAIVPTEDPVVNAAIKIELGTWKVTAGDANAIAAARAAAQVAADKPFQIQIGARFAWDNVTRDVAKTVGLGESTASNPPTPVLTLDGAPLTTPPTLERGKKYQFAMSNFAADPMLAFHWAVSTGILTKSETAGAELEIDDTAIAGPAHLLVTVRNLTGGVSWATTTIVVQ